MYSFTLHAEWKACVFERRMLKNTIYGHMIKLTPRGNYIIEVVTGCLQQILGYPNKGQLNDEDMWITEDIYERKWYKMLVSKSDRKRPFERPKCKKRIILKCIILYNLFSFCGSLQDYKIHMNMEIVLFA
jgi:hypothetical protein